MNELQQFFDLLHSSFDKIYIITLKRSLDRQEHFIKELDGLDYTIFHGMDKFDFIINDLKEKNIYDDSMAKEFHRNGKIMPIGMIACSWSHLLIYEEMINNNYEKILILEDDITIDKNALKKFKGALNELPEDWELLYLGYEKNEEYKPQFFFKKLVYHVQHFIGKMNYTHKTINNLYPRKVSEHIYTSGYHDHTHAYAITNAAAQKLIHLQKPIKFFPDNLLAYAATNKIIKSYIIKPKMINQLSQHLEKKFHSLIVD